MTDICEKIQDLLPELLRDASTALPSDCQSHLDECETCRIVLETSRDLGSLFEPPELIEPPEDLVQDTLDRCLVLLPPEVKEGSGSPVGAESSEESAAAPAQPGAFRSSVEILTRAPLESQTIGPVSRGKLFLRFLTQTAAAVFISVSLLVVYDTLQPAYAHAKEVRSTQACQDRLKVLWRNAMSYKTEFKDVEDLKSDKAKFLMGESLRTELIRRGYADTVDFRCPKNESGSSSGTHFTGLLFPKDVEFKYPVFWEKRVGTHSEGSDELNVVFSDGETRSMHSDRFFEAFSKAFSNWRKYETEKNRQR